MTERISAVAVTSARRLTHERVRLNLPAEECHGVAAYWDGALAAVLSRQHILPGAELWTVEFGFGDCAPPPEGRSFPALSDALGWIEAACRAEAEAAILSV